MNAGGGNGARSFGRAVEILVIYIVSPLLVLTVYGLFQSMREQERWRGEITERVTHIGRDVDHMRGVMDEIRDNLSRRR